MPTPPHNPYQSPTNNQRNWSGFRRDGKAAHEQSVLWDEWLNRNAALLEPCGLPPTVLRSRADWEYLLRYGYHCDGPYPNIDFNLDEQTEQQRFAFRALLDHVLTDDQKRRGCAGWHHVSSPVTSKGPD
jgi:hypothetical protein